MHKVCRLFVMAALAVMLCACGSGDAKPQLNETDLETMSDSELEALFEMRVDELEQTEASDDSEGNIETAQSFECLPEMLDASLEDCLIQIDNTIIRDDQTMTLNEVLTAFANSDVEYTYKVDDADYNADMLIAAQGSISVEIYKNGESYFCIIAKNKSDETVTADDASVIFDYYIARPRSSKNIYYCKGISRAGDGHTYQDVKEIFAEYSDSFVESSSYISPYSGGDSVKAIQMDFETSTVNSAGDNVKISVTIFFNAADSSCIGINIYTHTSNFINMG